MPLIGALHFLLPLPVPFDVGAGQLFRNQRRIGLRDFKGYRDNTVEQISTMRMEALFLISPASSIHSRDVFSD